MSKYTTELRFICETAAGLTDSPGFADVNEIINKAIPKVFNFSFPIFDENYRDVLCAKILMHYYTREIGEETVGLWKLRLNTRLNEIMPYFNQLYKSELLQFNPLYDVDLTTENDLHKSEKTDRSATDTTDRSENTLLSIKENDTINKSGDSTKTRDVSDTAKTTISSDTTVTDSGSTTNDDTRMDLFSETPQGALEGLETGEYLTNARKISDNKSETRSDKSTSTGKSVTDYSDKLDEDSTDSFTEDQTAVKSGTHTTDITANEKLDKTETVDLSGMENYINTVKGKSAGASYSKLLQEFRDTFLNIDMQVIDSLADLFINLW